MKRKKKTNVERVYNFLVKNGSATHKQIVKHLLAANGLKYNDSTRKRYDKLFYGNTASLNGVAVPDGFGYWMPTLVTASWY